MSTMVGATRLSKSISIVMLKRLTVTQCTSTSFASQLPSIASGKNLSYGAGIARALSSGTRPPKVEPSNSRAPEHNRLYTVEVRFEWDRAKATANLRTHRVRLAEAVTALEDEFGLTREDRGAVEESRFVTLGLSNLGNLLVVVYAYREPDIIRLISAWRANKRQRVIYEKGRR